MAPNYQVRAPLARHFSLMSHMGFPERIEPRAEKLKQRADE